MHSSLTEARDKAERFCLEANCLWLKIFCEKIKIQNLKIRIFGNEPLPQAAADSQFGYVILILYPMMNFYDRLFCLNLSKMTKIKDRHLRTLFCLLKLDLKTLLGLLNPQKFVPGYYTSDSLTI